MNNTVSGSQTTSGPGLYLVTVANLTITLETWTHWPDIRQGVTIKDNTGLTQPNITIFAPNVIGGAIDGALSFSINNPGESVTFLPLSDGIKWIST